MFTVLVLLVLCNAAAGLNCGGTYTDNEVTIEFPNYNNYSFDNTVCEFIFKDDQCSTQYFFNFEYFDLAGSDKCDITGLEIEGQDVLCGNQTGTKMYYSQNGILNVKFYSRLNRRDDRFKILVSKIPCETSAVSRQVKRSIFHQTCKSYEIPLQTNSEQYKSPWNYYYHNPIHWPLITQQNSDQKFCCATKYDSKHFMIASPNFLYGKNNPVNCVYHIYRAHSNICRIRFNFLYFSNGYHTTQGCQHGYLEIDGKYICGCKTDLKLSSVFDKNYGNIPKVLKFQSDGYSAEKISGFAVEVFQDECPSKHQPYHIGVARVKRASLRRDRRWLISNNFSPMHVAPYSPYYSHQQALSNPSGSYIDTTAFNPFAQIGWNDHKCKEWDSTLLIKDKLWRNMPQCSNGKSPRHCYEIRDRTGCLKTPGYPFYYPNNLNLCYR
ncbi:spermadhesin cub domain superfamily [Holotrichia oblita]|uniref:Spermadhesin cub domain superfamily n=1 Tax=Holotrichia oblita TaxID=644536 RepID=A0ACB9TH71_HOLOL|nr:spermadhesin cub domain superfamily [Holotrichia oblita]